MTVIETTVSFTSGPGLRLHGVLYTPELDTAPPDGFPAIVLCLGYRPVLGMFAPKYARGFAELGYAVLTFEYRGFGLSEGPRWRHVASEQLEDVRQAVTYLTTREDVDADCIALWGDASFGGAHAIMATAVDQRIRCVAATTPFADGELLLRSTRTPWEWDEFLARVDADRRTRVTGGQGELVRPEEILNFEASSHARAAQHAKTHPELAQLRYPLSETADALLAYKPVEHIHKIAPRPVLLFTAELDRTTPPSHARALYEASLAPKRLVVLRGAGHTDVHGRRLVDVMEIGAEWLASNMAPRTGDLVLSEGEPAPDPDQLPFTISEALASTIVSEAIS